MNITIYTTINATLNITIYTIMRTTMNISWYTTMNVTLNITMYTTMNTAKVPALSEAIFSLDFSSRLHMGV